MSSPSERGAAREEVRRNQQCWPPNLQCGLRHAMISARRVQQVLNACNLAVDLGELRFSEFHSLRVLEHSGTLKHCSPSLPHTLPHTQCTLERCIEVDRRSLASATFHGWCSLRSGSKRLSRKGAVTPNRYIASCPSGARERTPWSSPGPRVAADRCWKARAWRCRSQPRLAVSRRPRGAREFAGVEIDRRVGIGGIKMQVMESRRREHGRLGYGGRALLQHRVWRGGAHEIASRWLRIRHCFLGVSHR